MAKIADIYEFLTEDGDGVSFNATGSYTGGETHFKYTAPAPADDVRIFTPSGPDFMSVEVARLLVTIVDSATLNVWDEYGNLAALTNGISVQHCDVDGSVITDLTAGERIKVSGDWSTYCHDVRYLEAGVGDNGYTVRWTFAKKGVDGIQLLPGQSIDVVLRDNFAGIEKHYFHIQGEGFEAGRFNGI